MSTKKSTDRYAFQGSDVVVSTKRVLSHFALTQSLDCAVFSIRAFRDLQSAMQALSLLDAAEGILLDQDLLTEEARDAAQEDQSQRRDILRVMTAAADVLDRMRKERVDFAASLEREVERARIVSLKEQREALKERPAATKDAPQPTSLEIIQESAEVLKKAAKREKKK